MNIPFWKMHGAGNDFILVDDRNTFFPAADTKWIAAISHRRTGIGCEGVILIQPSAKADFRMRFFNPDGSEVEMCGNGARCVARLAHELGAAPARMEIDTMAGVIEAEVSGSTVRLFMTTPKDWRLHRTLIQDGRNIAYNFVNSGVPHTVVEMSHLDDCDVNGLGRSIRNHSEFAPAGTNVNFISVTGPDSVRIRTYERGVEAETLACGTGIVASALICVKLGKVKSPVHVTAASGDVLIVSLELNEEGAQNVTLQGQAVHVFRGNVDY